MQVSATRHSSGVSMEVIESVVSPCTVSGEFADPTCSYSVSGIGIGGGSGKSAWPIAIACAASMGSESDLAQPTSVGDPVFSMSEPKSPSPPATQLARSTVPHNAANAASRRGLITFSLSCLVPPPAPKGFFGSKYGHQGLG